MAALEGGRPRLISDEREFIIADGQDPTRQAGASVHTLESRRLTDHLSRNRIRTVQIGRERLYQILREHGISLQRTRTWKQSKDPDKDAKLDPIGHVTRHSLDRYFAFDQFGPLSIRPCHGSARTQEKKPDRPPATYHRTHGIRYFHACHSIGDNQLRGVTRHRKTGNHNPTALKSTRAASPYTPIYVIMDNLSANKTPTTRTRAAKTSSHA